MSDDEADPELLALLRQHIQGKLTISAEPETGVLEGAEYVYDNSIDVALDMRSCKNAAAAIHAQMEEKRYSPAKWSMHELHPKTKDESTVAFIFTMDLLNFSFWSEKPEVERFAVFYREKRWTGYWSLVAALQRALDEGRFPIFMPCLLVHPFLQTLPAGRSLFAVLPVWSQQPALPRSVCQGKPGLIEHHKRNPYHGLAFLAG
jgi:Potential Queuosine, Q, salvage protein family